MGVSIFFVFDVCFFLLCWNSFYLSKNIRVHEQIFVHLLFCPSTHDWQQNVHFIVTKIPNQWFLIIKSVFTLIPSSSTRLFTQKYKMLKFAWNLNHFSRVLVNLNLISLTVNLWKWNWPFLSHSKTRHLLLFYHLCSMYLNNKRNENKKSTLT